MMIIANRETKMLTQRASGAMGTNVMVRTISAAGETLVPVDSKHPFHADMFKTLDLLSLSLADGRTAYFVVEGCAKFEALDEIKSSHAYFYEEGTCPTNFIRTEAVVVGGDFDPHGLFDFVDTAWMTAEYIEAAQRNPEDALRAIFPQLRSERST